MDLDEFVQKCLADIGDCYRRISKIEGAVIALQDVADLGYAQWKERNDFIKKLLERRDAEFDCIKKHEAEIIAMRRIVM